MLPGLSHWSTRPLPKPATTMIGPRSTRYPRLYFAQSRTASIKMPRHEPGSGRPTSGAGSKSNSSPSNGPRTVFTIRGPMSSAPTTASTTLLAPSRGVNTKNTMASAGMFMVAEPCTIAIAPSTPTPFLRNAEETGTIQAEHRFMTGPVRAPLRVRLNIPPDGTSGPLPGGNSILSASPATRKAKVMPTATRRR